MRAIIAIDDELYARAREITGLTEDEALVREAFQALVEREAMGKDVSANEAPSPADVARRQAALDMLDGLRDKLTYQEQSAGEFVRQMRDDYRY